MDSSAHHQASVGADDGPLSAADRAELRWGLERVLLVHERAEAHDLARVLQRALRHLPVVMLHDRRLPGGLLADHLAVGPGGVTVVAGWRASDVPAPLTVECLRGIFGARAELLRDGACADRTALVAPVRDRVIAVRAVLDDRIPAYRLSIGARLPALTRSGLAAWWRPGLGQVLPDEPGQLVVDLRSGGYAAAWRPRRATLVEVKASTADGRPISHLAKAVRGTVARGLITERRPATEPVQVAAIAERGEGVGRVELHEPARHGGPWVVNVVAAA